MSSELDRLVYDWNGDGRAARAAYRAVELNDETLRDGLQGPSVRNPPLEVKKRLLHLMDELGIDSADIGLPGASDRARKEIVELARETTKLRKLRPNQAVRTHPLDVGGAIRAAAEAGVAIETCAFIGSSPIRRYAEDWSLDTMLKNVETSVSSLVKERLPVMFVTEDTTRADPETLLKLYETAIGAGATRICFSDTVGHATPDGVRNLLAFARDEVVRGRAVKIDYHGHNDRGLGTVNAMAATEIADRVHGCALGIGERVGNSSMDQLLINLYLEGVIDRDLSPLVECRREGVPQERPRARRPRVLGRPRERARPGAAHRGRPDERRVERDLLAGAARLRSDARADRPCHGRSEGERPCADGRTAPRTRRWIEPTALARIIIVWCIGSSRRS